MEKEQIIKLNEIRKELEISKEDFIKIIALAKRRRDKSPLHINDEMLYEIIVEALVSYDYEEADNNFSVDSMRSLINEERKGRKLSDQMLFDALEEYLDDLEKNGKNRKSPKEMVVRAVKSMGY